MRSDMGELLDEAARGAPPLRHDADSVLRAGRGRKRRRNASWAIAAVVAVTAAIGVPQLARREQAHPVTPAPVPTVVTTPARGALIPFVTRFQGYEAAGFRVADPEAVTTSSTEATVSLAASRRSERMGLAVYGPGTDPVARYPGAKITAAAPINGRRAFFLQPAGAGDRDRFLFWEYADGLLARLVRARTETSDLDMRKVAEGFRLGPERPVTVPLRLGYVPADYRLVGVSGPHRNVLFEHVDRAAARMATPDHDRDVRYTDTIHKDLFVQLIGASPGTDPDPARVTCKFDSCFRTVAGGRYHLMVGGGRGLADNRRMLESITMADLNDPATWIPINQAMPESVQLRVP
ncbi:hypothetical protein Aab01nite_70470 [Paractinoplanes abujensis]|uniref:Uncharacterized protein n=1 Tax=Paractinoplanes abujensis TaxID=882441 RepID=A0A7W7CWD3_9ACTN|nr:hypothetical protein [Actinoplanes abujensis]MBB4695867.1 hypothetical protein [Actinoplanes abujensis]GID23457.1 hypothetical protein Aab01nite_70470 [Actinoplanes abujensis]